MKIKTKLLLAFSMLPILLLILIGTGWLQLKQLSIMSETVMTNYELSIIAGEMEVDIKDSGIALRNIVMYSDSDSFEAEMKILDAKGDNIEKNISLLESSVSTPEQRALLTDLREVNADFNGYKDTVTKLISENKKEEAIQVLETNSRATQEEFSKLTEEIVSLFDSNLGSSLSFMEKDMKSGTIRNSIILSLSIIFIIGLLFKIVWTISTRLNSMANIMRKISNGDSELSTKIEVISEDEIDQVALSFNSMTSNLAEQRQKEQDLTWIKTNIAEITTSLSGTHDLQSLGRIFLSKVVPLVKSSHAVFYTKEDAGQDGEAYFKLISSYAYKERKNVSNTVQVGEGLLGQAIMEKTPIILTDVPSDYVQITSGLGKATPLNLYVLPFLYEGEVNAVLEIASFTPYTETQQSFLEELIKDVGIILESVMGRIQLAKLLEESQTLMEEIQTQSEELQNQQEELKATNEELEEQTQALRNSEEKLQMQQEELEQTNVELEEKAKVLEEQNKIFERTNKEVEQARAELEVKAEQLALSSKYKSEFLANMSHELRTPLNSLIILSKLLTENPNQNLTPKQIEYAKIIHSSGNDLLVLINDILDLAKIESGKMQINISDVIIEDLIGYVDKNFRPIINEKQIEFVIDVKKGIPNLIYSDEVRIQQVLKNLMSNAFKFTDKGKVTLEVSPYDYEKVAFSVIDTGIGISKANQEIIFEAFQQADGTTSRKYGGTGLGLSICKEIASLLGGELAVNSSEGEGSTFTFIIGNYEESKSAEEIIITRDEVAVSDEKAGNMEEKYNIQFTTVSQEEPNSYIKRLLIVDDDNNQRNALMELIGDMDFIIKGVSSGREAIEEIKVNHYDCIILDLGLSDSNGFDLLEKIKEIDTFSDVKVFVYTGRELSIKEEMQLNKHVHTIIIKNEHSPQRLKEELDLYLTSFNVEESYGIDIQEGMTASLELKGKKILLADDDVRNLFAISSILELQGVKVVFAVNGLEAIETLKTQSDIDLVLMDIMMPEMDGYEAIKMIRDYQKSNSLPIIALTAKAMKDDREKCLEVGASGYIVKPIEPEQLISLIKVWLYQ
jgi:signal transduction histidine kinase/DNA-binding response OmpR family regulator/HAMP domain-containing protein